MSNILADLKLQLANKGIENPESFEYDKPTELDQSCTRLVAGGFGQLVGFNQSFTQNQGPGSFVQNMFTQNLG